jgi:hypothetical protein
MSENNTADWTVGVKFVQLEVELFLIEVELFGRG